MRVDWCVSSWFRIKNTHSHYIHTYTLKKEINKDNPREGWETHTHTVVRASYFSFSTHTHDCLSILFSNCMAAEPAADADFAAFLIVRKNRDACIHWLLTYCQAIEREWSDAELRQRRLASLRRCLASLAEHAHADCRELAPLAPRMLHSTDFDERCARRPPPSGRAARALPAERCACGQALSQPRAANRAPSLAWPPRRRASRRRFSASTGRRQGRVRHIFETFGVSSHRRHLR